MLLDHLHHAHHYYGISPNLALALQWLEKNQSALATMENGQYPIDGENVYAIVNSYDTKTPDQCGWEAHKVYCDIHYSVQGGERIAYAPIHTMTQTQAYNAGKDYSLYTGTGDWLAVCEGMFCLLLPQDIHAPGAMLDKQTAFLKKVVIKLKL